MMHGRLPTVERGISIWRRWEVPTWALCAAVYGGWTGLTLQADVLPWWLLLPLGGWFTAWHYSFQHEVIHGHPTPWRRLNDLLGRLPVGLVMPYGIYRQTHLRHHHKDSLTLPGVDPESFYFDAGEWAAKPAAARLLHTANNTLAGRLSLGPLILAWRFWRDEIARLAAGDFVHAGEIAVHAVSVSAVFFWLVAICGLPWWLYVVAFAYPGLSLTLLRSFLEHRAMADPEQRTANVEGPWPFGLLFLHNNLHVAHHENPGLAWYDIPRYYAANREVFQATNGGYVFAGYGEVARRYLIWPVDSPVHPGVAA